MPFVDRHRWKDEHHGLYSHLNRKQQATTGQRVIRKVVQKSLWQVRVTEEAASGNKSSRGGGGAGVRKENIMINPSVLVQYVCVCRVLRREACCQGQQRTALSTPLVAAACTSLGVYLTIFLTLDVQSGSELVQNTCTGCIPCNDEIITYFGYDVRMCRWRERMRVGKKGMLNMKKKILKRRQR